MIFDYIFQWFVMVNFVPLNVFYNFYKISYLLEKKNPVR